MRLAFSTLGCPDFTFRQCVDACVRYGFHGMSIRMLEGTTELHELRDFSSDLAETLRLIRETGIEILCVSTGVRFTAENAAEREAQLDDAKRSIDLAAALSAPFVRLFGGTVLPALDRAATMANIENGFRASAEYAAGRDVTVLLETHDTFSTGRAARDLVDRIAHPAVGVVWDILHSLRFGEPFRETTAILGKHIRNVHLKDSRTFDENRFDLVLCGEGRIPIADALLALDAIGYEGYYELEWERGWHPEIADATVAFPQFVRYITQLRASLATRRTKP